MIPLNTSWWSVWHVPHIYITIYGHSGFCFCFDSLHNVAIGGKKRSHTSSPAQSERKSFSIRHWNLAISLTPSLTRCLLRSLLPPNFVHYVCAVTVNLSMWYGRWSNCVTTLLETRTPCNYIPFCFDAAHRWRHLSHGNISFSRFSSSAQIHWTCMNVVWQLIITFAIFFASILLTLPCSSNQFKWLVSTDDFLIYWSVTRY